MDAADFKKIFLPYHRRLYGVALRMLGNEDDARDVLQDAYLKLWDKREALGVIDNVGAFCMTLVRNMCIDLLRSPHYVRDRQQVQLTECLPVAAPDDSEVHDNAQVLQTLIARLPLQQQQVIRLRDMMGYSYQEVEQLTGLSTSNVRVILSRARKKIREDYLKLCDYERRRD